ncbi:ATP-dependent DNA helicase [Leucobacter sp. HY1910]
MTITALAPAPADPAADHLDELTQLLTTAVQIAVGSEAAAPRPGQLALTLDIWRALASKTRMNGIAPTGTGKSLAHMSCAALAAYRLNERTVISTDSLALQTQFMEKDLPVVAQAVARRTGFDLQYAVLKGVSNYVDPVRALELAQGLTGMPKQTSFTDLAHLLREQQLDRSWTPEYRRGEFSDLETLAQLALWALEQYLLPNRPGDRDSCAVEHTNDDWQLVSASSDEKAGEEDTGYVPKADEAKELAAEADIVVTNHVLLGMQAARGIPTVLGSRRLGRFHNIIVDEAHTLPSQVRTRGAAELSEITIKRAARAVGRVLAEAKWVEEDAMRLSDQLNRVLSRATANLGRFEDTLRIGPDQAGPVEELYEELDMMIGSQLDAVKSVQKLSEDAAFKQKCRRAIGALTQLGTALEDVITPNEQIARWVTPGGDKFGPKAESSPVDVSGLIFSRLWHVEAEEDGAEERDSSGLFDGSDDGSEDEDEEKPKVPLGVACVSATLPTGFYVQAALPTPAGEYASPFGDAYAGSAMYVPRCLESSDISALEAQNAYGGKRKFDTFRHEAWCVDQVVELVRANGGSALILSAKAESGKKYAAALRKRLPQLTVHSQWDGGQVSRIVDVWRKDVASVLVGTRSLFTGVDAPGETNSLVIIDRVPRAPRGVIDEARMDLMVSSGLDKWTADRLVYVADAAQLLEQGIGRAIRGVNDRAMVAVLDPRLLAQEYSVFNYQTQTRHMLIRPLLQFGHKFNELDRATAWLNARRDARG